MNKYIKCLYNYGFSWKIFGKKAKVGDRLTLKKVEDMNFGEMVEDSNGVFIFLPPQDHHFYERLDKEKVNEFFELINSSFEKLNKE